MWRTSIIHCLFPGPFSHTKQKHCQPPPLSASKAQSRIHFFSELGRNKMSTPGVGQEALLKSRPCTDIRQRSVNGWGRDTIISSAHNHSLLQDIVWLPQGRGAGTVGEFHPQDSGRAKGEQNGNASC